MLGGVCDDRHRLIPCLSTTQPIKASVRNKRSLLAVVFECIDHQIDGDRESGQDSDGNQTKNQPNQQKIQPSTPSQRNPRKPCYSCQLTGICSNYSESN